MKSSAEELVSEAYSQGISDGHGLNRRAGVDDEIAAARALDVERAELLAALKQVLCAVSEDSTEDVDCDLLCAAIARAEGRS